MQRKLMLAFAGVIAVAVSGGSSAQNDGERIVNEVCSGCHNPKVRPIEKMHKTRAEWAEAVDRMIGYGADVPKDKIPQLLDYLAATHGPEGGAGNAKK